MATDRQIEANRNNAARSTGPKSAEGKARSRGNATKHGLAGESSDVEAEFSPEFAERRARWGAERQPVGEDANWALDRAVAASLRIERCERAIDEITADTRQRARLAWDQDRRVEAAAILGRLALDPVLASRRLETNLAGVGLLIEAWLGLAATLEGGSDWSEPETSKALDLLGIASDSRSGRTPIDPPGGVDPVAFRSRLALEEVERLERLRDEAMAPLDEMDRRRAMVGDVALFSKRAQLVLRYERDAWRRYRESMGEVKAQAQALPVAAPSPAVPQPPQSQPTGLAPVIPSPSPGPRTSPTKLIPEPTPEAVSDLIRSMTLDDMSTWVAELHRHPGGPLLATDRTQFADFAVGRGA